MPYYYNNYGYFLANNVYWILLIPVLLLTVWAQIQVSGSFRRFNAVNNRRHMPVNRAYDVDNLFAACHRYFEKTGRRISFEYAMADAKAQNIPVLSYLANHFASMSGTKSTFATILEYGASIIALVAIFKSFFGHYLGTLEGLNGLILKFGYKGDKKKVSLRKLNTISMIFIMGSTWVVAYANPNILDLIEAMGAPIIASLLCLLPMYAIRKAPALAKYKGRTENIFVTVVGLLTILNIVYKLF